MRWISLFVLLVAIFFSMKAYPLEHSFPCYKDTDLIKYNMNNGYAFFATAEENNGIAVILWINLNNGDWLISGIDNNHHACNMLAGADFRMIRVRSM